MKTAMEELETLEHERAPDVREPAAPEEVHNAGRRKEEGAAGLIEIAAVILVVAILTIGGLFLFGAFSGASNDSVAQQNAANSLTEARSQLGSNGGTYPASATLATALSGAEPNISYTADTVGQTPDHVAVTVVNSGNTLILGSAAGSSDNKCFFIVDNLTSSGNPSGTSIGTQYATGTAETTGCATGTGATPDAPATTLPTTWNRGSWS